MAKNVSIRDPIYNYIGLTPLEEAVVTQPIFQRLRFIRQNSTLYLTYPSNNSNRFCHSLGVMHMGGLMFKRALENSDSPILRSFLDNCQKIVEFIIAAKLDHHGADKHIKAEEAWSEKLRNACGFGHRPDDGKIICLKPSKKENDGYCHSDMFIINVLWQSVRLASLLHDLGHMPFSHLFETALKEYRLSFSHHPKSKNLLSPFDQKIHIWRKKIIEEKWQGAGINFTEIEMHEQLSAWIMDDFISYHHSDAHLSDLAKICYPLATLIFLLNRPEEKIKSASSKYDVLHCLHTIISSDMDADRLDYCVRDPYYSGLEYGAIDTQRIVDSLKLHFIDGKFKIYPSFKAISGLEGFYHQRYLLYKFAIFHHSVSRMDSLLAFIINLILEAASSDKPNDSLLTILKSRRFIDGSASNLELLNLENMIYCDDEWLRAMLMEIHRSFKLNAGGDPDLEPLLLAIDTFLFRQSENMVSLWKRETDFFKSLEDIKNDLSQGKDLNEIKTGLRAIFETEGQWREQFLEPLRDRLAKENVSLLFAKTPPKIFGIYSDTGESTHGVITKDGVAPIHKMSPYIESLKSVADGNQFFHLFFLAKKIKSNKELESKCRGIALSTLKELINMGWADVRKI